MNLNNIILSQRSINLKKIIFLFFCFFFNKIYSQKITEHYYIKSFETCINSKEPCPINEYISTIYLSAIRGDQFLNGDRLNYIYRLLEYNRNEYNEFENNKILTKLEGILDRHIHYAKNNPDRIFSNSIQAKIGSYNFTDKFFPVEKFPVSLYNVKRQFGTSQIIVYNRSSNESRPEEEFFGKIYMSSEEAEKFISNRSYNKKIDRDITAVLFFTIDKKLPKEHKYTYHPLLTGNIKKIEFFNYEKFKNQKAYYLTEAFPIDKIGKKIDVKFNEINDNDYFIGATQIAKILYDNNPASLGPAQKVDLWVELPQIKFTKELIWDKQNTLVLYKLAYLLRNAYDNFNFTIGRHDNENSVYMSQRIADDLRNYLIKNMVDENKLSAVGYGAKYKICNSDYSDECMNKNNRVAIHISNNLTEDEAKAAVVETSVYIADEAIVDSAAAGSATNNDNNNYNLYLDLLKSTTHWSGYYDCRQGRTVLNFDMIPVNNRLEGVFSFNFNNISGKFKMIGMYDIERNKLSFEKKEWIDRPNGYEMIDIEGELINRTTYKGVIKTIGCDEFYLIQR